MEGWKRINENQQEWSLKPITYLFKWTFTAFFRRSVDPEADEVLGLFKEITRPIDLETVRNRLYDGNALDVPS
jgi:hypothetical protein